MLSNGTRVRIRETGEEGVVRMVHPAGWYIVDVEGGTRDVVEGSLEHVESDDRLTARLTAESAVFQSLRAQPYAELVAKRDEQIAALDNHRETAEPGLVRDDRESLILRDFNEAIAALDKQIAASDQYRAAVAAIEV